MSNQRQSHAKIQACLLAGEHISGPLQFLNLFQFTNPVEPPHASDPGMTVAETEELMRQLQLRHRFATPNTGDEDEYTDRTADDIDGFIDPSLRNEGE